MRIFSGVQPTGYLHIGNYLGALKQWVELQHENDCLFCIVDLHAITIPYNPEETQKKILNQAASYLAVGLDPEKAIIFTQSKVREHTELCWLLNTITPLGELYRMTQYKEKSEKHKKNENAGLLNYPILMAADILLYDTDIVPVGEDQKQHVELARDIARRFNNKFGETFVIPKVQLPPQGARIMSLSNPKKKMSKSDGEESYISLFDTPEEIKRKIKVAVTDTGKEIKYDPIKKPGISNLLTIYSLFSNKKIKELEKEMKDKSYKNLKEELAELITIKLTPFREKRDELLNREVYVREILHQGEEKARVLAEAKMNEVKKKMGL
jgi:tryptophanyl-tRNA synthetase